MRDWIIASILSLIIVAGVIFWGVSILDREAREEESVNQGEMQNENY